MPTIPGSVTEIRYRRTGPLAGKYYHRFGPGVRMRANADGSVTLRGRRKIHATEDEPGFWQKYGGRHRANPERRCIRCGTPTVYKSGICRYCQTPAERSTKASERGIPRRGGNPSSSQLTRDYIRDLVVDIRSARKHARLPGAPPGLLAYADKQERALRALLSGRQGARIGRYGVPEVNPSRRRSAPRPRRARESGGLPWGLISAVVFLWAWSLNRGAVAGVTAPGDTTSYVSLSDVVRGMQAEAEALAVAAEAEGSSYVSLSDWVRSL